MKIVHVVSSYPPHLGGVENCVREIVERLATKGHQIDVFTSNVGCSKNLQIKSSENLRIHYLKGFEIAHTPIIPDLFFKLLKTPKDAVFHVHVAQVFVPEIVYIVSKIRKIPYVVHLHTDVGPSGKLGFLLPLYKKTILKHILKSAEKIIILTKEYQDLVKIKYGLYKNVEVIPNGVGEDFFIDKKKNDSNKYNLLFVGRLTVEKNVPKLIEAVSMLKSNIELNIVGDGERKNEIEKLIESKNIKNVFLRGKKTDKDLIEFYRKADIFLLASDYEGLPLVLLEAMASGTPIVGSDVIGIRDFVGNAGVLVNPPTAKNFAGAIDNLLKSQHQRIVFAKRGRKKVLGYTWNKIVDKVENVYREILI